MKTKLLATALLIVTANIIYAQKIKYKDLFPTLSTKNWSEGIPQLKTFLADPKNADEPNANLQMAFWLEDRFLKIDAGVDTVQLYQVGDSAVFFFEKAKGLITEKELKKHDEYYQAFFRRDLRTGEFGIKESDVHLDIEKKVETIENRMESAKNLNVKVDGSSKSYNAVQEKYKQLTQKYSSYNELLLGADDEAMAIIQQLKMEAATSRELMEDLKKTASVLKTSKFQEDINMREIKNFGIDGTSPADLGSGKIELWDYESWAVDANSEINGSIGLLKSMISNYSGDIRQKKNTVKKGTDTEIDSLSQDLVDLFDKYDSESVAKRLLLAEAYEVRIMKQVDISINKALQDSSLVGDQLDIFSNALALAEAMSLELESINLDDLNQAKKVYEEYINSFFQEYGTASNFVGEKKTWVNRQKGWLRDAVEYWTERNRWGIVAIEGEPEKKIPLYVQDAPETEFYTIGVPLKTNQEAIVFGANISEKKGFVYGFDAGRLSKWTVEYELPGDGNYQFNADTIPAANGSSSFYLLNESVQENNLSVVSYSNAGALNWNAVITVPKPPVDFKFDEITQELTILLYPEEQLPLDNDELGYLVIDRTGNAR